MGEIRSVGEEAEREREGEGREKEKGAREADRQRECVVSVQLQQIGALTQPSMSKEPTPG